MEDQGDPPWEEEEIFQVELNRDGEVVDILKKDLNYLHEHDYA